MTLHQLQIFVSVARHLNFTKASQELRIAQPAVYLQIKALEESCGVKLYKKLGRQILLTAEGERFRDELGQILPRLRNLENGRTLSQGEHGLLAIGGSHLLSASVLSPALTRFRQTHPNVRVLLRTKTSPTIERLVSDSEIEFGLITQPQPEGGLVLEPFRREKMVTVLSSTHPLARRTEMSVLEFAEAPLIIRERQKSASRQLLDQIEGQGLCPNILMKCDTAKAVKMAVMSGLGLGLIYKEHVQEEIRAGKLKVVKVHGLKEAKIQSFIAHKPAAPYTPIAVEFLELLRRMNHSTPRSQNHGRILPRPFTDYGISKPCADHSRQARHEHS